METTLLKKLPFFFVFFCFMGFFPENKCITGKIQHFSILLSITTSFTSQKTFKNKYFTLLWIIFRNIFWIFGAKNNYFQKRFSVEK